MSWTSPKTWLAFAQVTAAEFNQQIRDNFNALWNGTTAGDIDYYTSSTAKTRLGIGAAGTILAPSGAAPAWSVLSAVTYPARLYLNATQNISSGATTQIGFQAESYDPSGVATTGASAKYTAPVTGYYQVNVGVFLGSLVLEASEKLIVYFYVDNGMVQVLNEVYSVGTFTENVLTNSDIYYLTAGQYIDVRVNQNSGLTVVLGSRDTFMSVARVG